MEKPDVVAHLTGLSADFATHLHQYQRWRDGLTKAISDYQNWVEQQELVDGEQDLRVYELVEALRSDKITIAVVAEFSRGKSELLNAIFFADHKERLIPAAAGRTTMCPTELRYDQKDGPCLKLLPIETRKTSLTIAEYKKTPIHWTTFHILKPHSSEELRELFLEVTRTKKVHLREAHELGFYDGDHPDASRPALSDGFVEVPVWRHAIVNYPHPLLKKGLVLLDTPGLNALGAEPELTLNMLPTAHAIVFVLAADTGVTRTDLQVWRQHVNPLGNPKVNRHIVVLNKIDILWDQLHDSDTIAATLARQAENSAHALGIDTRSLFPVSAQKGFAAKISENYKLLQESGLPALEAKLAEDVLPSKHEIIRNRIIYEISGHVENSRALLKNKLAAVDKQLAELKRLGGKNLDTIQKIVSKIREQKSKYDKEVEGFKVTHKALLEQANTLLGFLSLGSFDKLIKTTRRDMHESWTTYGLKTGMETFFRGTMLRMENVAKQSNEIISMVNALYEKLHMQYGLPKMSPPNLKLVPFIMELRQLERKGEAFRKSPVTMMTEQHFLIKKFFISLVSQARNTFVECDSRARSWFNACISLVSTHVKDHRDIINQNLTTLKKIHKNMDSLGDHIAELERTKAHLEAQIGTIDNLLVRIQEPFEERK